MNDGACVRACMRAYVCACHAGARRGSEAVAIPTINQVEKDKTKAKGAKGCLSLFIAAWNLAQTHTGTPFAGTHAGQVQWTAA